MENEKCERNKRVRNLEQTASKLVGTGLERENIDKSITRKRYREKCSNEMNERMKTGKQKESRKELRGNEGEDRSVRKGWPMARK